MILLRSTALALSFNLLVTVSVHASEKPNIVLILADDMGFDAVSAHNDAMGPLKTPAIDKLIEQGMNFIDAHSGSAVCTPTRYGLLTGRYCWRTELRKEVLWDYGRPLIEPERLTVAELLKKDGYTTGMVGKWHLGLDWYDSEGKLANSEIRIEDAVWKSKESAKRIRACAQRIDFSKPITGGPVDHGFDYFFGVDLPNMPPYAWIAGDRLTALPTLPKPDSMFGTEGPMVPGWQLEEILPTLAQKSTEWIRKQAKSEKPFFLYLPLTSPHTPISPSRDFKGKSGTTAFGDFLIETDWVVGQIMKALNDAGVSENTLLIFTTDNGTAAACNFRALEKYGIDLRRTLKGIKSQIHEGGHRVPFVVRWPGKIKAGSTCKEVIGLNDFMATMADLIEMELPKDAAEDSTSILPLLLGETETLPDRPLVVHHDYKGNFAIRSGKWKLVGNQLFDLETDLKETTNVAAEHMDLVEKMAAILKRYQEEGRSRP
ncbi:MAG: arylsulfatase [Akkermansiaceae bacterium]